MNFGDKPDSYYSRVIKEYKKELAEAHEVIRLMYSTLVGGSATGGVFWRENCIQDETVQRVLDAAGVDNNKAAGVE